ncbi:MAG: TetR family transcriptional regulator C-terminal domain-containing protein, partial [Ilumatobacteraceae bacterium]
MKKQVDERRTEILDATCAVVAERGFGHARIADVANRLGVSTGLIHYHFESKDQLLSAAFAHAAQRDIDRLDAALAATPDPVVRIAALLDHYLPAGSGGSWAMWIDAWGESIHSVALQRMSQRLDHTWKDRLQKVVEDAVAGGAAHCTDTTAAAWRIGSLIDGLSVQVTVHGAITTADARRWALDSAERELGVP